MTLLLDTHVLLWFLSGDTRMPVAWRTAVGDPANAVFVSVASIWEAVIKYGLGKLPLADPPQIGLPRDCAAQNIDILPIELTALPHLAGLPPIHRDPFDRIIVAQALELDLTVASLDASVRGYPVKLLQP